MNLIHSFKPFSKKDFGLKLLMICNFFFFFFKIKYNKKYIVIVSERERERDKKKKKKRTILDFHSSIHSYIIIRMGLVVITHDHDYF